MKTILNNLSKVIFTILVFCSTSAAQTWNWATSTGMVITDQVVDNSQNIIIGGNSAVNSQNNFSLCKINANGVKLWSTGGGGVYDDRLFGVTSDSIGNVYATGFYESNFRMDNNIYFSNDGLTDMFLLKYDPNGNLLWAKKAGGGRDQIGRAVVVDKYGNIYVTGEYYSSINFGSTELNGAVTTTMFIAKFTKDGNIIWAKDAKGAISKGMKIMLDNQESPVVTGTFFDGDVTLGSTTLNNKGGIDGFVAKYSPNGEVIWAKSIFGKKDESAPEISCHSDGSLYLLGSFWSDTLNINDKKIIRNISSDTYAEDLYVSKWNSQGIVIWVKKISGVKDERLGSIESMKDGSVLISGESFSPEILIDDATIINTNEGKIFMLKYAQDGTLIWHKQIKSTFWHPMASADKKGNIYLTITEFGTWSMDNITLNEPGGWYGIIGKLSDVLTLFNHNDAIISETPFHPNPISDDDKIVFSETSYNKNYVILSNNGNEILSGVINEKIEDELKCLKSGTYFFSIINMPVFFKFVRR